MLNGKSKRPSCLWCGQRLERKYASRGLLVRLANTIRIYPFECEGCRHRFFAFAWRTRYVEWDGQVLVMPDYEEPPPTIWDGSIEFYKFAVIWAVIGLLAVVVIIWLVRDPHSYRSVITDLQKGFTLPALEPEEKP